MNIRRPRHTYTDEFKNQNNLDFYNLFYASSPIPPFKTLLYKKSDIQIT